MTINLNINKNYFKNRAYKKNINLKNRKNEKSLALLGLISQANPPDPFR